MDDRFGFGNMAGGCGAQIPDRRFTILKITVTRAEARRIKYRSSTRNDIAFIGDEKGIIRVSGAKCLGNNMSELGVQRHDVGAMDSAIIIDEFNIAGCNCHIIFTVITHFVSPQCHCSLCHNNVAGCQHTAVILIDRNGVSLEPDFGFGKCRRDQQKQPRKCYQNTSQQSHQLSVPHATFQASTASLFQLSSPCF